VVLGIVRAHQGAVTVKSERGRGSVFQVFLPVSAEAAPRQPVQERQVPTTGRGNTVLIVEDEPTVRKAATLALGRDGFSVLAAADGVEALEIFRLHRNEIGCVVCDLTMPRMDGWQTLTALRRLAPGLPVILASGFSETQVMEGDHPERPQLFLHKPYELKDLREAIRQVLVNWRN
jgi:CheY-like chemotaxis protein